MIRAILICAICFLANTQVSEAIETDERYLQVPVDHFDQQNRNVWTMRYLANDAQYQEGGPIFIYVGGDFQVGTFWLENGHMFDIASDLNGIIFGSEMRYFGLNHPTSDLSTPNLRFLTIEQALADIAHLIDHIRREDPRLATTKVILVGSMFGANLATWFRIKYPHHSDGLWSSSSFVEARMNFREYYEAVGEDVRSFGSNECYSRIWRSFRTIQNLIDGGRSELLDDMFHLCHPLDVSNEFEVIRFYEALAESISQGIVNGVYTYVHDICEDITNANITNDLLAFSEWFRFEHRSTGCFEMTFQERIDFLSEDDWNAFGVISGRRQFHYLSCVELGWFATTDSVDQPFGNRIGMNYFTEMCQQVFGDWITEESLRENTERSNVNLGGRNPTLTNAFFTNGGIDPNRFLNVIRNIGNSVEAKTLPLYGHSQDLYSLSPDDSTSIRNAKIRARELITEWVQD